MKKLRGEEEEEVLLPLLSSSVSARALSGVPGIMGYQESCPSPGAQMLLARGKAEGKESVWDLGTNWCHSSWQLPRD